MSKQTTTGSTHLLTYIHLDAYRFWPAPCARARLIATTVSISCPVRPVLSSRLRSVLSLRREFTPVQLQFRLPGYFRFCTLRIAIYRRGGLFEIDVERIRLAWSKIMVLYLFFKTEIRGNDVEVRVIRWRIVVEFNEFKFSLIESIYLNLKRSLEKGINGFLLR